MKNVTYILRLALTLLLITGVMAAALAGVNAVTAQRIAAANREKIEKALAQVLPEDSGDPKTLEVEESGIVRSAWQSGGAYALEVAPSGFDGEITMMVGVDESGKVLGIAIVSHTETAGLGAVAAADNARGEAFRGQFLGLSGELAVSKDGGAVDALTGATITSRAIVEGVNAAIAWVAARKGA